MVQLKVVPLPTIRTKAQASTKNAPECTFSRVILPNFSWKGHNRSPYSIPTGIMITYYHDEHSNLLLTVLSLAFSL